MVSYRIDRLGVQPPMNDLRYAFRALGRSPGLSAVAIASLALGIGANAAIFSVVNAVVLQSLPVSRPNELVVLRYVSKKGNIFDSFRYPDYRDLRDSPGPLSGLAALYVLDMNVSNGQATEQATGELVSGDYFSVLGVRPAMGRLLGPDDDRVPGGHPVCVISASFWRRQFGSATDVLSKSLRVNGRDYQIVGVMPEGFEGTDQGSRVQLYVPLMMATQVTALRGDGWINPPYRNWNNWLKVIGRLKPGVTFERAQAILDAKFASLPVATRDFTFEKSTRQGAAGSRARLLVAPGRQGFDNLRLRYGQPLTILLFLVGLLLLIACANVANLLLARAEGRTKEIATRLALGASRWTLIRHMLAESALLGAAGVIGGALLSMWLADLLVWQASPFGSKALDVHMDGSMAVFLVAAGLTTVLLFGIGPALRAARIGVASVLKSEGGGAGRRRNRTGSLLVVAQVGLSMVLLSGSGLLLRSLYKLESLPLGFEADNLVLASVSPGANRYDAARSREVFEGVLNRGLRIPGVRMGAAALFSPLSGALRIYSINVPGYQGNPGQTPLAYTNMVGPGYFATLGQRLLNGREFTDRDRTGAPQVAVITAEAARRFWAGRNPVGEHFRFDGAAKTDEDVEVVGVVQDAAYQELREEKPALVYLPLLQTDARNATILLRVAGPAEPVMAALQQAAHEVDPDVPLYGLRTMENQIAGTLSVNRMLATVAGVFGVLALVLAMAGLYAVLAYAVARRSREIGIRMALGAERVQVIGMVIRDAFVLIGWGVCAGIPLSFAASRWITSYLFGLKPQDPLTYAAILGVLGLAAFLAAFVPSRKASTVDPMVVLRYD